MAVDDPRRPRAVRAHRPERVAVDEQDAPAAGRERHVPGVLVADRTARPPGPDRVRAPAVEALRVDAVAAVAGRAPLRHGVLEGDRLAVRRPTRAPPRRDA